MRLTLVLSHITQLQSNNYQQSGGAQNNQHLKQITMKIWTKTAIIGRKMRLTSFNMRFLGISLITTSMKVVAINSAAQYYPSQIKNETILAKFETSKK